MSKNNRQQQQAKVAAPAATPVQQTEKVADWLRPYAAELRLLNPFFAGDESVADQIRAAFAAKLASDGGIHKGPIDGAVNQLVVLHGKPLSTITLVLGDNESSRRTVKKANQAIACSKEAGRKMQTWNRLEGQRVIEAWEEKHAATAFEGDANMDVVALLSSPTGSPARARFPEFYDWAYEEKKGGNAPHPQRPMNEATLTTAMKLARLEGQIAELEMEESKASKVKDWAKAGKAATQIAALRQEVANLTSTAAAAPAAEVVDDHEEVDETPAPVVVAKEQTAPPVPVATAAAPVAINDGGNGRLTLPQAIAVCRAPEATKRLKKVLSRYENDDEFDDVEFVATVEALL